MNPRAARRELYSFELVLVAGLAALTSSLAAALGNGGFGGGAGGALLLLRRAGGEKHGGGSQSQSKETDHCEKSRLVTLDNEVRPEGPSAYLEACIGGAGGGGVGLEAQETRPPAMNEAARARNAYFIVWCSLCLLFFSRPHEGHMEYRQN